MGSEYGHIKEKCTTYRNMHIQYIKNSINITCTQRQGQSKNNMGLTFWVQIDAPNSFLSRNTRAVREMGGGRCFK